jgi:predicted O-linked N-acetylglucosamine transferase (SPINDLY family)
LSFLRETLRRAVRLARDGRLTESRALLSQAEGQSSAPEIDHGWARVLTIAGERTAAADRFRRYLRRVPADFWARSSLAALLAGDGRMSAARRELAAAVDKAPLAERALLFNEFGNALVDSRHDEAIDAYAQAVGLSPEHAQMRLNLASALSLAGRRMPAIYHIAVAQALDRSLLDTDDPGYLENQLLALVGCAEDPVLQRRHATRLAAMRIHGAETLSPLPRREPGSPLHVGYVSPDFRHHAVASFFAPILAAHARDQVKIHLYGEVRTPDAVTEHLKGLADGWLTTCDLTARRLAERIRADAIDVLVDLAGWTVGSRLDAFAYRPAPVQLTWLGYPTTTGLDASTGLDGRLTDAWADPPGETENHFTERLLRLGSGFIAYRPLSEAHSPSALPPATRNDFITFGSFNNAAKISGAIIALWTAALKAVPGSRLVLKNHALGEPHIARELRARFVRAGLATDRLDLRPSLAAYDDHLRAYEDIDIALDTFPYNGTTTTCEALCAGVPVITLAGRMHASRVGVSLLSRLGLNEWIATTDDEFVACAVALAGNLEKLETLRVQLPKVMLEAPLFDPKAVARDLEGLYRQLVAENDSVPT